MKKPMFLLSIGLLVIALVQGQSVGIGTNAPNSSSILDLGQGGKPLILPRLTTAELSAVPTKTLGMIAYNTVENQLYAYQRYGTSTILINGNLLRLSLNRWQPVSTGPQMIAWGVVDSFATEKNGSGNYSVVWDASSNWYTLTVSGHNYYKDSMLLIITAVGNGSWDQAISTGELIDGNTRRASIKFTDVSRSVAGWSSTDSRRRSWFHFVLYNLRKDPYNILSP